MRNRIIAGLLAAMMAFTVIPASNVYAEEMTEILNKTEQIEEETGEKIGENPEAEESEKAEEKLRTIAESTGEDENEDEAEECTEHEYAWTIEESTKNHIYQCQKCLSVDAQQTHTAQAEAADFTEAEDGSHTAQCSHMGCTLKLVHACGELETGCQLCKDYIQKAAVQNMYTGKWYLTLADAVADIEDDDEEYLLNVAKSHTGPSLVLEKYMEITIYFENGTTSYTITDTTESYGILIKEGAFLDLDHGTLNCEASSVTHLIENQGDLYVEQMTIDARKAPNCSYVLYNQGEASEMRICRDFRNMEQITYIYPSSGHQSVYVGAGQLNVGGGIFVNFNPEAYTYPESHILVTKNPANDTVYDVHLRTEKTDTDTAKKATCIAPAYEGNIICEICGEYLKKGESVGTALGHDFDDSGICKNQGCTAKKYTAEGGNAGVTVQPGDTDGNVSGSVSADKKKEALQISSSIKVKDSELIGSAEQYVKNNQKHLIQKAMTELGISSENGVEIIVQPQVKTEVKALETGGVKDDEAILTVDIKLEYQISAKSSDGNTKELYSMNVEKPDQQLTISFEVTQEIAEKLQAQKNAGKKLYIRHPKSDGTVYFHEAELNGTTVTFLNDAGFSEFSLMVGDEVPETINPSPAPGTSSGSTQTTKKTKKEAVMEETVAAAAVVNTSVPATTGDSSNTFCYLECLLLSAAAAVLLERKRSKIA